MVNTQCKADIIPLGKESSGFDVVPMTKIKWSRYPYKISINNVRVDEVREICNQTFKDGFLSVKEYLYISNFEDYKLALILFEKKIVSVSGPITQEHIDILLSNYPCVVRPHLWYKLYDAKVEFNWWALRNANSSVFNHKDHLDELLEFVIDNLEEPKKVVRMGYRNYAVYSVFDHVQVVEALSKLQYPKPKVLTISRCVLWSAKPDK